jgi:hypothetical protein
LVPAQARPGDHRLWLLPEPGHRRRLRARTLTRLARRNEKNLDDVPESVRKAVTFHLVSRVDDVPAAALEPPRAETGEAA